MCCQLDSLYDRLWGRAFIANSISPLTRNKWELIRSLQFVSPLFGEVTIFGRAG
jgi:hypothetical protein